MASIEVRDADPQVARTFLTGLERASGIPPVDEDEQRRLGGLPPVRDPDWGWAAHLVEAGGTLIAYAGIRSPRAPDADCAARVDLAIDRGAELGQPALAAALAHLRGHACPDDVPEGSTTPVEAWLRGATAEDLATAADAGFHVRSRLHVLGVTADAHHRSPHATAPAAAQVGDGLTLRPFDPSDPSDEDAVVGLLVRAYPELADWYPDGFAVLRAADWFRPDDLLLLSAADGTADDGRLLALHWMKRRGEGVGEVYNLAVDPSAQGRGLGPLLLDAGLAHLFATGSREVVLWVDADNARALALYRSRGFTDRWDDVSLVG